MHKGVDKFMQPIDLDIRNQILECDGNVAISASAGTGKTHTTVEKINIDTAENTDFRTFAAITFTRKAAKEIRSRLKDEHNGSFVGTNDNFVLSEIIQPFMRDVYGEDFKKELSPDYSNDYLFDDFETGVETVRNLSKICKYSDKRKNFSFELSLKILKASKAAREYLASKYFKIYIDEYQDCDKDMHNLFMYISTEINIPLFIVGDIKQSIYGWRGAYADGFKKIINGQFGNFKTYILKHNFRSNLAIQNYSNLFIDDVRGNCKTNTINDEVVGFAYRDVAYAISYLKKWIDLSKDCAVLIRSNDNGKHWNNILNQNGLDFTYIYASPLDYSDMESEHVWIARLIANYILQNRYTEYHFVDEIPTTYPYEFKEIKSLLTKLKKDDEKVFKDECFNIYRYFGFESDEKIEKEIVCLYDVVTDEKYIPTYNISSYNHIITTIHASKGLEFEQVVIQSKDYNLNVEDDLYLHYVAVSRPKEKLLVLIQCPDQIKYINSIKANISKCNELQIDLNINNIINGVNSEEFANKTGS